MIYTVTFNPAIDYVMRFDSLTPGRVNRSTGEDIYFGGKGINVSAVLAELGIKSRALGFTAGFTGQAIEDGLAKMGIETDFVRLSKGFSRINVKLRAAQETELNGCGPDIGEAALDELFSKLEALKDGDTLVLAGSIPPSLPEDIYERMLASLAGKAVRTVVDASGGLLMRVMKYRPFLVKPNNHELGEMFGAELTDMEQIEEYAGKLREMGAQNVLVSMAGDGALLLDSEGKTHRCGVCKGTVKNSVGAGDSMVAGFLAGLERGGYEAALKLGTAAGGATAFSEGLAKGEMIERMLAQLTEN